MPTGISDGKQCYNFSKYACIVLHILQFHVASVMENALHFPEIFWQSRLIKKRYL